MSEAQRDLVFPFEVENRFRPLLVGLGVTRHTAWARISDSERSEEAMRAAVRA